MTPCPHCDQAAVTNDGCCVHCGADRSDEAGVIIDVQDFTDPDFVLGAVLAQVEDLSERDAIRVLIRALVSFDREDQ